MTVKTMTVYWGRNPLIMAPGAMAELGWEPAQQITEAQVREGIAANARAFCREMDQMRAAGDDVPDTSDLAKASGHTGTQ